jgi:(R,R)-butanediol dehydrogenase/meso-butanediol dehydrogenase/diacetyl reductase
MRAARYYGQRDIRVEQTTEPPLGDDDVRIDVSACGICGSDLHEYTAGPIFVPEERHPLSGASVPIQMGHEVGGVVTAVGDDVSGVTPGDAVAIHPTLVCGDCRPCREGAYNRCTSFATIGLSADGGGFAESMVVPAGNVVRLPDGLSASAGAVVEPYSVALRAVRRAELRVGDAVAVFGAGPIGLMIVQAARSAGATTVLVSEPQPSRREVAAAVGASATFDPTATDVVEAITERTDGGVDVAFEGAGVQPTFDAAIRSTKRGGRVTVVSISEGTVEIQPNDIVTAERTVIGTLCYRAGPLADDGEFRMVCDLLADGTLDPDPLVTDRVALDRIVEDGFEPLATDGTEQIKILVEP